MIISIHEIKAIKWKFDYYVMDGIKHYTTDIFIQKENGESVKVISYTGKKKIKPVQIKDGK